MKVAELKASLSQHPERPIRFVLPTGSKIPPHAHVTEVARNEKQFVDCGGTFRTDTTCRVQAWTADDTDHRLTAGKLLTIFEKGARILKSDDLDVEIECEAPFISHFPVSSIHPEGEALLIHLATKHTACLAEDKCMSPAAAKHSISFKPLPLPSLTKCCA